MSIPIRSSDELLAALREHPEWREAIRREILTGELLGLPAKLEKAELERREDSREIRESMQGLAETTRALAQQQEKTEDTLQSFMDSTERRFIAVENLLTGMSIKLDELDGKVTQRDAVEKLDNYLHKQIDPLEVLARLLLSRMFAAARGAGAITEEERDQLGDADALAVGEDKKTGELACAAAEVSTTVNVDDVERAGLRSELFLKALRAAVEAKPKQWEKLLPRLPAKSYALVIGRRITEEARREAERRGVLFANYRNGQPACLTKFVPEARRMGLDARRNEAGRSISQAAGDRL
ncbi:hypothetical protein [Methylacidimicrobium tartarophylax]|uniref:Uncharacterized protein n=1 Tax=Methylacidimicrobium tartarophylax TaxID=1041768 RepID=A0A5E6MAB1_9BACT|nr:hypothetical protein [Methylacidimicrobium tartarophylax]VVM06482.1 hypothetical protein MAMT_01223 [Methylacidimicrobium tartarophylax]